MPTSNIIGYLWSKRQDLDVDGLPDLFQLISDLQRLGLDAVHIEDISVLGVVTGTSVELVRKTDEEWGKIVGDLLIAASVEHTLHMIHRDGEHE